jgi:DNA-binding HxlR family transcriptional regulator
MDESCTVYNTLDLIGKKWVLLIVLSINRGGKYKKRYSEIKKDLHSITGKILSLRLRELEKNEIIKKEIDKTVIPIKTYYSLTKSGKDLLEIIKSIKSWGLNWNINANKKCCSMLCRNCL